MSLAIGCVAAAIAPLAAYLRRTMIEIQIGSPRDVARLVPMARTYIRELEASARA